MIADQVGVTPCVFLAGLHRAERTVADRLTRLANGTLPWPWIDPDKALPWVEKHIDLALAASQVAAVTSAHRINQGSIPDLNPPEAESDFYFVQVDDPETAVARIIELVKTRIPKRFGLDPIRDIQVLCPMNRGGAGARSLNIELQAALNPAGDRKVERFGWRFAPGDKVMQIENDYEKEVYNCDIGTIDDVDANSGEPMASFDGRSVTYGFGELDMLVPAYAATIHKSQGSEYPAVIIPVLTQHYAMLQRNLLYTGVTRGKSSGRTKKAVAIAVRNCRGGSAGRSSASGCGQTACLTTVRRSELSHGRRGLFAGP